MRSRKRTILLWAVSGVLAALFLTTGGSKLGAVPPSPENFARWGLSPTFMYCVGSVEVACAIGLLVPRAAPLAALILIATMLGALKTGIVFREPLHVALPLVLIILLGFVARERLSSRRRGRATRGGGPTENK
jgi:uncharacterized membrane protein YphA (DoxX/SURF4 family)